jgi:hypothetical protein
MTEMILSRYAGWSAYVSAMAMVFTAVTWALFLNIGQPWGTISEITIIVLAVMVLDILLVLLRLHRPSAPTFSLIAYLIGLVGMLMAIGSEALSVLGIIEVEPTELIIPTAFGLLGISLVLYSYLAFAERTLPRGMVILGLIAGMGYVLVIAGLRAGSIAIGLQDPLALTGSLLAAVFYPLWAIWLGRLIFSDKLI